MLVLQTVLVFRFFVCLCVFVVLFLFFNLKIVCFFLWKLDQGLMLQLPVNTGHRSISSVLCLSGFTLK